MDFASAFLSLLTSAAVRSLVLALAPLILLAVLRVRSAATRHAVLFLTAAGMMTTMALHPLLPAIPLRILGAPAPAYTPVQPVPIAAVNGDAGMPQPVSVSPRANLSLAVILDALYLAGLAVCLARLLVGALFTRRLINAAAPIEADLGPQVYESSWISVPFTFGWLRPRILVPAAWRDWTPAKLEAVLAHERNHVCRGDWAISVVAALNRSIYWFNPVAWSLERRLASLAEQACDDAALLSLGCREAYAEALLDMAAAVQNGQGRRVWEAMAMAKGTEVRIRIDRILDESRPIPRGLTRSGWIALTACSLLLIYFTAVVHPAPAQSREQVQGISPGRNTPLANPPASAQEAFPAIPAITPAPTPLYKVDPVYPPLARAARIEGTVALAVVIAPDGQVRNLRVLHGHPLLLQAALDAVKQWTFPPISQAGSFGQDVTFSLLPEEGASPQDLAQIAHAERAAVWGVKFTPMDARWWAQRPTPLEQALDSTLAGLRERGASQSRLSQQLALLMIRVTDNDRRPTWPVVVVFADKLTNELIGRQLDTVQITTMRECMIGVMRRTGSTARLASRLQETLAGIGIESSKIKLVVTDFIAIGEAVRGPDDLPLRP